MGNSRRSSFVLGLLLILFGAWFLLIQVVPNLNAWFWGIFDWPVYIIGAGILLFFFGILSGAVGMSVPASIVGGIGGLLYWQNATGDWESWAYVWSLIPGFVGVGIILSALLGEGSRGEVRAGGWLIVISLILFLIFGSFLGLGLLGVYWPVLLIILGLWILLQPIVKR